MPWCCLCGRCLIVWGCFGFHSCVRLCQSSLLCVCPVGAGDPSLPPCCQGQGLLCMEHPQCCARCFCHLLIENVFGLNCFVKIFLIGSVSLHHFWGFLFFASLQFFLFVSCFNSCPGPGLLSDRSGELMQTLCPWCGPSSLPLSSLMPPFISSSPPCLTDS